MRLSRLVLRSAALDLDVEDEAGIKKIVNFMAGQVKSLSDKDVCYGFYSCVGVYEPQNAKMQLPYSLYVTPLMRKLTEEYQRRLVKWFEFALLNRANEGGGGTGIKKIESGIAAFVEAIPKALATNAAIDIAMFVPDNEYLVPDKLGPLGAKIFNVVKTDAKQAGILRIARAADFRIAGTGLSLVWDPKDKVWIIPPTMNTWKIKDQLGRRGYGFKWTGSRWQIKTITPAIRKDFTVEGPASAHQEPGHEKPVTVMEEWFWKEWYPKNFKRFTDAFTNYARNLQSSYSVVFSTNRKQLVKFKRTIKTADDAIEELRYRYIGRQGRGPWLAVMNEFLEVRSTTPTNFNQVIRKIDLLNGMQHSNGLFMEHFPKSVASWYKAFLNAKFSAPDPEDLARYISDKDLKELMLFLTVSGKARPEGKEQWSDQVGDWEHHEKDLPPGENWRAKGYPRKKGKPGEQPDRFDPKVQKGLLPRDQRGRDDALFDLWRRRED
jgi:hypothetical protein